MTSYSLRIRSRKTTFNRTAGSPAEERKKRTANGFKNCSLSFFNAGDRNRTGTVFLQQDFKSCASASSATPAKQTTMLSQINFTAKLYLQNGTYRARTYDPLLVRQMLSQLS